MSREVCPVTVARAPGKVILVGEHAVVYGRAAVALPVNEVRAQATAEDGNEGQGIVIVADDLGMTFAVGREDAERTLHPLEVTVVGVLQHLGLGLEQDLTITVSSTVPIARGLGSGAAVSTAITRAVASHFSSVLTAAEVSRLVYEVERLHHGTPSGIDNTVIAYDRPVYFVRGERLETFTVARPMALVIADTGLGSPTKEVVDAVRQAWLRSRDRYEDLFDRVGSIAAEVRRCIERGDLAQVGHMMDENHRLLQEMEVSHPRLDALVQAATRHGSLGAKLSGAGRGGNMIALVSQETRDEVEQALWSAGAQRVIQTEVLPRRVLTVSLDSSAASLKNENGES
jgi:mevalonate kinase